MMSALNAKALRSRTKTDSEPAPAIPNEEAGHHDRAARDTFGIPSLDDSLAPRQSIPATPDPDEMPEPPSRPDIPEPPSRPDIPEPPSRPDIPEPPEPDSVPPLSPEPGPTTPSEPEEPPREGARSRLMAAFDALTGPVLASSDEDRSDLPSFRTDFDGGAGLPSRKPLKSWAELQSSAVVESPADDLFGAPDELPQAPGKSSLSDAFADFDLADRPRHTDQPAPAPSPTAPPPGTEPPTPTTERQTPTQPPAPTEPRSSTGPLPSTEARSSTGPLSSTEARPLTGPLSSTEPRSSTGPLSSTEARTPTGPLASTEAWTSTGPLASTEAWTSTGPLASTEARSSTGPLPSTESPASTERPATSQSLTRTGSLTSTDPRPSTDRPATSPTFPATTVHEFRASDLPLVVPGEVIEPPRHERSTTSAELRAALWGPRATQAEPPAEQGESPVTFGEWSVGGAHAEPVIENTNRTPATTSGDAPAARAQEPSGDGWGPSGASAAPTEAPTYDEPIGPQRRPEGLPRRGERSATTIASLLTEALAAYQSTTDDQGEPHHTLDRFDSFLADEATAYGRHRSPE